jgi:hypothetical protein
MLTQQQTEVLRAALNRIIPADEYPGACEAGVEDYLRRQFARDLQPVVEVYRTGLDALDAEARQAGIAGFAALGDDEQDALLGRIERGDVSTAWSMEPERFFRMMVEHAMEGFYADPGNGGNKDEVSWKMIGFEVCG